MIIFDRSITTVFVIYLATLYFVGQFLNITFQIEIELFDVSFLNITFQIEIELFDVSFIFTRHPSPVTRHPPPATRYPPPVTRHPPPVTRHPPPVTRHPPPVEKCCRPPLQIVIDSEFVTLILSPRFVSTY